MIVVVVTLSVPIEEVAAFIEVMERLVVASRRESGVIEYSFAIDILDKSLIRILEIYQGQSALDLHMTSKHFLEWREASRHYTRVDRRILNTIDSPPA